MKSIKLIYLFVLILCGCASPETYDVLIKNGIIVDGSGNASYNGDIGINADTIVAIGNLNAKGNLEIDATGLVVAPGFINILSWAVESLIEDGKSQSDIRQGVTLEVFGEGWSMGPLNEKMKKQEMESQGDIKYDIEWNTLNEYLEYIVNKGVSPNVASFVGAITLRINTVGFEDRAATNEELETMKSMVKQAMEEGALGVGSSLIYAPAFYSSVKSSLICRKNIVYL